MLTLTQLSRTGGSQLPSPPVHDEGFRNNNTPNHLSGMLSVDGLIFFIFMIARSKNLFPYYVCRALKESRRANSQQKENIGTRRRHRFSRPSPLSRSSYRSNFHHQSFRLPRTPEGEARRPPRALLPGASFVRLYQLQVYSCFWEVECARE